MNSLLARAREVEERLRATRDAPLTRDAALFGARVGLAWIFIYHGSGTLFGAFGGAGIHKTAEFFSSTAHLHPGTFFAVLNGIIEFFGGIAVGLGIFGRLAALALVGDMAVAMATVTWHNGIVSNAAGSGYELNVALGALAWVVALMGTGRFSLDVGLGLLAEGRRPVLRRTPASTVARPASDGVSGT
jgi:putative oxidoreductase